MNFIGTWKNNNEQIKLSCPNGGDEYLLEYDHEEDYYRASEAIEIFRTNNKHSLLVGSRKFGRCDMFMLKEDEIRFGNIVYKKE